MLSWTRLHPIEGEMSGCGTCGVRPSYFEPNMHIAVGFGYANLTRDGEEVWAEQVSDDSTYQSGMSGAEAEALAAKDPDHDWRITLHGPLSGRTYQRHEAGKWALVKQDQGFA